MADILGSQGQSITEVAISNGPASGVVSGSGTGAATPITATLAAAVGKTTYITGFLVSGLGATSAALIAVTVTGLAGGTQTFYYPVPAGVGVAGPPMWIPLPSLPGSAQNTAIVVNVPSFGSGNTAAGVSAEGYQR